VIVLGVVVGPRREVDDRDPEGADAEAGGGFVELDAFEDAVDRLDLVDLRVGYVCHRFDPTPVLRSYSSPIDAQSRISIWTPSMRRSSCGGGRS
jgi:hypothetical protein